MYVDMYMYMYMYFNMINMYIVIGIRNLVSNS